MDKTSVLVEEYTKNDLPQMAEIWNSVVEDGVAFPQTELLDCSGAAELFASQSFTGVARNESDGRVIGLYILHPNNVGRCGHICNASFAVRADARGCRAGEKLVLHCIETAKHLGFRIMQFNAVVSTNRAALHLYEKLGFVRLGVIPDGFLMKDGRYEDIIPHYRVL